MTDQTSKATIASRQERAAGRILDDEGLRGDLADDEYQPLQEWALEHTDWIAASTAGMSEAEAEALIDKQLTEVKDVVRAAGAAIVAHAEGDAKRRASELAFVGKRWERSRQLDALARRLDAEPGLSGPEIATLIVEALGTIADERPPTSPQESAP